MSKPSLAKLDEDPSPPATPKAQNRSLVGPTDTVLAQHVRNVQVPDSVVQDFKRHHRPASPTKQAGLPTPSLGRSTKNLTLKEQSGTIDRLQKENFSLKLSVYFYSLKLDKLSDEGVKEMISENVELKTEIQVLKRDARLMRKKVRELEEELKTKEGMVHPESITPPEGRSPTLEYAQDREEELLFLRERLEEYEIEIESMRNDAVVRESEKRRLAEHIKSMDESRAMNVDIESREQVVSHASTGLRQCFITDNFSGHVERSTRC
jgi:hypothetical protein